MVWYKALIFFVNSGCEKVQFECGLDMIERFFPIIHHSWQAPAALRNHTEYQQTACTMQFSPCLLLNGFSPIFQHAERDTYGTGRLCWPKFPRLVGTVKFVCTLCEFWWWKVQLEWGYVWMVFSSFISPPTQAPHNPAQNTSKQLAQCKFSPCLFLHGFCSIFQHAERDTYRRLCWTTVFPTLVGTVNLFVLFVNSGGEKCS